MCWQAVNTARVNARKRRCSSGSIVYRLEREYSSGQSTRYTGALVRGRRPVRTEKR